MREMLPILALCLAVLQPCGSQAMAPPRQPPASLLEAFTLNGTVPLEFYYVDDSNQGRGTHYKYSQSEIAQLILQAEGFIHKALAVPSPRPPPAVSPSTWRTQLSDIWLVHALQRHSVAGHTAVVFGSTHPWYECLLLALGASHVTTVEYNKLTYSHPLLSTTTPSFLDTHPHFHTALSISSFDHDGLGRYGDPVNPNGDLVAMDTVRNVMEEGGLFFLTVPVGPDVVVWNLHRRYGPQRLPQLLCGWEQVEAVGWEESLLTSPAPFTIQYEPVLVLRPLPVCASRPHIS